MVQVYREPLCRRHYSGLLSPALCLRVAVLFGAVVLSFLLAFATGGFWRKADWEMEQPAVHYTGDGVALFEGVQAGQEQVWATSPALQDAAGNKAAAVSVQIGELDANFDGRPDMIHFTARLASTTPVHSIKLLLQFTYALQGAARVKMYGLAYVTASSPLPGAGFAADGVLALRQAAPLAQASYNGAYNMPLLGAQAATSAAALNAHGLLDMPALLSAYAARNLTTAFEGGYPVWTAAPDSASGGEFLVDVRIRIPPHQLLLYRPSLGAMLKWGWVQFLAAFAAVWWLAAWFEWAVFRFRVLETRVVADVQPRPQKFA